MSKRLHLLVIVFVAGLFVSVMAAVQMMRFSAQAYAPTELDALYIPASTVHQGSTLYFASAKTVGKETVYGISKTKDGITEETLIQGLTSYDFDVSYDCGVIAGVRKSSVGANELAIMSVRTGDDIRTFSPNLPTASFTQMSFSPDGSQFAVNYSFDAAKQKEYVRAILVFQANGQSIDMQAIAGVVTDDSTNTVSDFRWSADGTTLAWVEAKQDQYLFSKTVIGSDGIDQIKSSQFNSLWRTPYYEVPGVPIQGRYSQKSCREDGK